MTREEAIEFIGQSIKPDVDMAKVADAIKALEQEPQSDIEAIRREIEQTVSRYTIARERGGMGQVEWSDRLIKESDVMDIIDKHIPAKVQAANMEQSTAYYNGGWIPVSERLPEEYGEYLITWTTSQSKRPFIEISEGENTLEYDHEHNRFKFEWLLDDYIKAYPNGEVIAWMPLPEPFEPQERSDEE